MRNCASGKFEIPGLVLAHHPGMTTRPQCAPFSVQEVEQVVITPLSQAMQTATHCFMFLGLYGVKSLLTQVSIEPVTSLFSGLQPAKAAE